MEQRTVICASCDIGCQVVALVENNKIVKVKSSENPLMRGNICMKGIHAPRYFEHEDRLMHPLKRVGDRGSGQWERVTWVEAMDDIAARLQTIIDQYGPEGFAVSTSQWNTSVDNGSGRRFMNALGAPNWISGVAMCAGNTAAINRMTYGWYPYPDYSATNCIVLFGHNPRRHSWTPIYKAIRLAQQRGATLIVLDPRKSEMAERADVYLPLRIGTDAAMCLGWLNVIFNEGLYDETFVEQWTVGYDALKQRVDEYSVDRVAEITGVEPELIRQAARTYATSRPAVIPWTPITDQQVSSTSAIRLHSILRAVCGNLDVPGGEILHGFNPHVVPESDLERHDLISEAQKAKQLGSDTYPAFTYRGTAALGEPTKRVYGREYANIVMGSYMANPTATFKAMAYGDPYPVKALISLGNNTLLSFPNQPLVYKAMMNQDLIVVHELFKTPTAQLADYILPGDTWLERPYLHDVFLWSSMVMVSEQAVEPPGECQSVFTFWRDLATRMGLEEHFPHKTLEEVYDYRLQSTGMSYQEFSDTYDLYLPEPKFKKYEKTGFATPSGKVELSSSILADLGFDPVPYYREAPQPDAAYPFTVFVGVRDDEFFQTGMRQSAVMRKRKPDPHMFIHADDAKALGIADGDWCEVESRNGLITLRAEIRPEMPRNLIRVPHGWWLPETEEGGENLSGAFKHNDGMLVSDEDEYLDREQGIPHFKGFPGRVRKCAVAEHAATSDAEAAQVGAGGA